MSVDLNGTVVLVLLLFPAGLLIATLTAPRWAARSMSKHAMWRLRDEVVDDTLTSRLPHDHPAVQELVDRVEWAIAEARSLDFLHFFIWTRARGKLPQDTARRLEAMVTLDGLDPQQAERVRKYRMQYNTVAVRGMLLSSWAGVAVLLRYCVPALREALRAHSENHASVTWSATVNVVSETDIGERAREFVTEAGPDREPVPV